MDSPLWFVKEQHPSGCDVREVHEENVHEKTLVKKMSVKSIKLSGRSGRSHKTLTSGSRPQLYHQLRAVAEAADNSTIRGSHCRWS